MQGLNTGIIGYILDCTKNKGPRTMFPFVGTLKVDPKFLEHPDCSGALSPHLRTYKRVSTIPELDLRSGETSRDMSCSLGSPIVVPHIMPCITPP